MEPTSLTRLNEASNIIQKTSSLRVLKLVFQFHLYPEGSREILEGRWMTVLDSFLHGLRISSTHIEGMTKGQKVKKILRQIQPRGSAETYKVSKIDTETWDDRSLATQIDNTSYSLFKTVSFEAWVAVVLDRSPESVKQFSEGHSQLRHQISKALLDAPAKYTQYCRLLDTLHCPFAKLALRSALEQRAFPIKSAAWFIIDPLCRLFEDKVLGLEEILLRLNVLAQRYKRLYICDSVTKADWDEFRIDLAFPEALGDESYRQIANSITNKDKAAKRWRIETKRIITLKATWKERVYEVVEFVHADSAFSSKFDKVALCLYELRNFNSLLPVLQGLKLVGIDHSTSSSLYRLTEHHRNYANYREAWENGEGGVPLLLAPNGWSMKCFKCV